MAFETATPTRPGGWHALADRIIDWWRHGPGRSDLDQLSPSEIARMAHDLGLSSDELTRLSERGSDAGLLLYERLQKLGLTPEDIERTGFRHDLERTCGLCKAQDVCRHDLEMRPEDAAWKAYCPNCSSLEAIEKLKQQAGGGCCGKA